MGTITRKLSFALNLVCALAVSVFSASGGEADPQLVGVWPGYARGLAQDIFRSGDLDYLGATTGMFIVNNSDPSNPQPLGRFNTSGAVRQVTVVGSTAYISASAAGLFAVDVSNPANPVQRAAFDTPGSAQRFVIDGNLLYLTDFGSGLEIYDISDPTKFSLVGSYDTPGTCRDIVLDRGFAYIADQSGGGLQIIDVSNPQSPAFSSAVTDIGSISSVVVEGDRLYVTRLNGTLRIYDLLAPGFPVDAGNMRLSGFLSAMVVKGNIAYVAADASGLHIVDVSVPSNPVKLATHLTRSRAAMVDVVGTTAYIGTVNSGIEIIDVSNLSAPVIVQKYGLGDARDIAVAGDHAFLADGYGGLRILDVKSPQSPALVRTLSNIEAHAIALTPTHAFVAAGADGLKVFDLANPASPQLLSTYKSQHSIVGLRLQGSHLNLMTSFPQWEIVDVSDPANPQLLETRFSYSYPPRDALISGGFAYVIEINNSGAGIFSIIPDAPGASPIMSRSMNSPRSIELFDHYALVASDMERLMIYDIADPTNVAFFGSDTPFITHARVFGKYAFLAAGESGVAVADLHNITNVSVIGNCDTAGAATRLALANSKVFVADGTNGLSILTIPAALLPRPTLQAIAKTGSSPFKLRLAAAAGTTGRIEKATILGEWTTFQTVTLESSTFEIPDPQSNLQAFYRFVSP